MRILCIDSGSSSLRFAVYDAASDAVDAVITGEASGFGRSPGHFIVTGRDGGSVARDVPRSTPWNNETALAYLWQTVEGLDRPPAAVGHRIVFGGPSHAGPVLASDEVLSEIKKFRPLDPLHLDPQLAIVGAAKRRLPDAVQVLCFDSAFHRRMPRLATMLPLPRGLDPLLQRFGYHGLSYEYVIWSLADASRGRMVVAHLGSGASLSAVLDGRPLETTMGFSPLGGMMMGTRPGDLDPGVLLYLLGERGFDAPSLSEVLTYRSGLLGVSGVSDSMETLLAAMADQPGARDAVALFLHGLTKSIGSLVAVLDGLDTLVFTGGIGEHAAYVRAHACSSFRHLGLHIDEAANDRGEALISTTESAVAVRVVRTDESLMIARHTAALLGGSASEES